MQDNPGVIGVVLAGGASRRMGRDKALLDWHGRPLLDHVRARLWEAGCEAVITSRAAPGCIADYYPDHGPLGGIHAVVRAQPAAGYLVVPVDMPLMPASLLRRLVDRGERQGACHYRRSFLPCYLKGGEALAAMLERRLRGGDLSLAGFLRALNAWTLDGGDEIFFLNTNTPDTWRTARALDEGAGRCQSFPKETG